MSASDWTLAMLQRSRCGLQESREVTGLAVLCFADQVIEQNLTRCAVADCDNIATVICAQTLVRIPRLFFLLRTPQVPPFQTQ